jgi:hypothetical protein
MINDRDPNAAWREEDAKRRRALAEEDQRKASALREESRREEAWRADERRKAEFMRAEQQAKLAAAQQPANNALMKHAVMGAVGLTVAAGVLHGVQQTQVLQKTEPDGKPPSLLKELKDMFKPSIPVAELRRR